MFTHVPEKVEHSELIVPHEVAQNAGTLQGKCRGAAVFQFISDVV